MAPMLLATAGSRSTSTGMVKPGPNRDGRLAPRLAALTAAPGSGTPNPFSVPGIGRSRSSAMAASSRGIDTCAVTVPPGWASDRWSPASRYPANRSAALPRRRQVLACLERGGVPRGPRVYSGARGDGDAHAVPVDDGIGQFRFPVGAHAVDEGEGMVGDAVAGRADDGAHGPPGPGACSSWGCCVRRCHGFAALFAGLFAS